MAPGFLVASIGMFLLTHISLDTSYPALILPGLVLMGLGMGTAFMPAMSLATYGVQPRDAGVASAMVNTSQQVGGAIGTALLSTVAHSAGTSWAKTHAAAATDPKLFQLQAQVHSYSVAIWWAFGILVLAGITAGILVNAGKPEHHTEGAEAEDAIPVMAH
jgi:MFS family permease